MKSLPDKYGPWALVTGASSGIGAEFVRQVAAHGLNVVLVARREERMNIIAREIERAHSIKTRVIVKDLSATYACEEIFESVRDLDVGLLVNNAGIGWMGPFHKGNTEHFRKMVVVNSLVPALFTKLFFPRFLRRKKGGIIFVSSTAAFQPVPFMSLYAATKAFDLMLAESLWEEYRKVGVDVLAVSPGMTESEFHITANVELTQQMMRWMMHPRAVVDLALKTLGQRPSVVPGFYNKLVSSLYRVLPRSWIPPLAVIIMGWLGRRYTATE